MATDTINPSVSDPTEVDGGNLLRLSGVDWRTYSRLLKVLESCPGVLTTYDRGELEIMSPSFRHDNRKHILSRLVIALTEECGFPVIGGGSTTLRKRRKLKGLEPDECFWIGNAERMEGRDDLDLRRDPPPDIAIEVDTSRSSLGRLEIYDTLGVPEVWRLHGQGLSFFVREGSGGYGPSEKSLAFPWLNATDLQPYLQEGRIGDQNRVVRSFRAWVQLRLADEHKPTTGQQ